MENQMLKELYDKGIVISDMKEKMKDFFDEIDNVNKKLNKYVHKQGLKLFYIPRNQNSNQSLDKDFVKSFIYFLEETIGIVAVMRLAIDPFPILLMDEEILLRTFDSLTEPYSPEFVDKYISKDIIEGYKKTDIYMSYYNSLIIREEKNYEVFNIMWNGIIDTTKKNEILKKIDLLDPIDKIATYIALSCEKVVRIYAYNGIQMYFTDRKEKRNKVSWSSEEFKNFEKNDNPYNMKYDEAYISVFKYIIEDKSETFFVEHNEKLNENEISNIKKISIK